MGAWGVHGVRVHGVRLPFVAFVFVEGAWGQASICGICVCRVVVTWTNCIHKKDRATFIL